MRIRTIKPEWLDDERLAACSDAARVLSIALITLADDAGRGRLGVITSARIFPQEPSRLEPAFLELEGWYVTRYQVRGQTYFAICNWDKHQAIDRRRFRTLTPDPEKTDAKTQERQPHLLQAENLSNSNMHAAAPQLRRSCAAEAPRDLDLDLDLDRERDAHAHARAISNSERKPLDWQRVAGLYAKRYQAARGIAWHYAPHTQALTDIAIQASQQEGDPEEALTRALDHFFSDPYVQSRDYPPALLAKQFGRHLAPPAGKDPADLEHKRKREAEDRYNRELHRKLTKATEEASKPPPLEVLLGRNKGQA